MATKENSTYRVQCERCPAEATVFAVLRADVRAHEQWRKDLSKPGARVVTFDVDDLDEIPGPAHWHLTCETHYAGDEVAYYSGRLAGSRRGAVDLIRHLSEKEWVGEHTGWGWLAARLLAPVEAAMPRGQAW